MHEHRMSWQIMFEGWVIDHMSSIVPFWLLPQSLDPHHSNPTPKFSIIRTYNDYYYDFFMMLIVLYIRYK